jgi:hypothetical protein
MKNAAKCDTQCELQNPRVIRSLNASGGGVKTFMFVSVWKGITHLNAIEVMIIVSAIICDFPR